MVAVRKSLLIGVGILVLVAMALIAIRPTNDFAFVKPYIDGERTSYQEIHQTLWPAWPPIHGSSATETVDFVEVHSVVLQGMPNKEFAKLLRNRFSHDKGWTEPYPVSWEKSDAYGGHLNLTKNNDSVTVEAWPLAANRVSVKETKKLSVPQRWLVRLIRAGANPFERVFN